MVNIVSVYCLHSHHSSVFYLSGLIVLFLDNRLFFSFFIFSCLCLCHNIRKVLGSFGRLQRLISSICARRGSSSCWTLEYAHVCLYVPKHTLSWALSPSSPMGIALSLIDMEIPSTACPTFLLLHTPLAWGRAGWPSSSSPCLAALPVSRPPYAPSSP